MRSIKGNQKQHFGSSSSAASEIKSSLRSSKSDTDSELLRKHGVTQDIQIELIKLKINQQQSSFEIGNTNPCPSSNCDPSPNRGTTGTAILRHVRIRNQKPETLYKCETCGKPSKTRKKLQNHIKTHSNKKEISCTYPECNYKCHLAQSLKIHMRIHSGKKPYQCQFCEHTTRYRSALKSHFTTQHVSTLERVRPYKCTSCNYAAFTKQGIRVHIRLHTGEKSNVCEVCKWRTNYQESLNKHMQVHHQDQTNKSKFFPCQLCDYSGRTKYLLQLHQRTHTGEKPYKCEFCPYASTQSSHLKTHLRTHTKEKPYKCTLCPYTCTTNTILLSHVRSHTGERPFACKQCDYRTTQRGHLNNHVKRRHTAEGQQRNFQCPLCSDAFYTKSNLETHIHSHTGEKPYKCRYCYKESTQSGANNQHEQSCNKRPDRQEKVRSYHCTFLNCKHSATSKSGLKYHLISHRGGKIHACSECEFKTAYRGDLNRHLRLRHAIVIN